MSDSIASTRKYGSTLPITMTVKADGVAIDISNATNIRLGYSKKITTQGGNAGAVELQLSGEFETDGTDGKIKFPLTSEQAKALAPGRYYCDVAFELGGDTYSTDVVEQKITGGIVS